MITNRVRLFLKSEFGNRIYLGGQNSVVHKCLKFGQMTKIVSD
jgi:hypothetical protein